MPLFDVNGKRKRAQVDTEKEDHVILQITRADTLLDTGLLIIFSDFD